MIYGELKNIDGSLTGIYLYGNQKVRNPTGQQESEHILNNSLLLIVNFAFNMMALNTLKTLFSLIGSFFKFALPRARFLGFLC